MPATFGFELSDAGFLAASCEGNDVRPLAVTDRSGAVMRVPVIRLTAEIADPDGNALVSLERVVPTAAAEDVP